MKLLICLDEKNKYCFFNKRQSSDEKVLEYIKSIVDSTPLYITEYTNKLFSKYDFFSDTNLIVANPNEWTEDNYFCFVEIGKIPDKHYDEIYIFNWNRHYPSSENFTLSLEDYDLLSTERFEGKSHPEIDVFHYIRKAVTNCETK